MSPSRAPRRCGRRRRARRARARAPWRASAVALRLDLAADVGERAPRRVDGPSTRGCRASSSRRTLARSGRAAARFAAPVFGLVGRARPAASLPDPRCARRRVGVRVAELGVVAGLEARCRRRRRPRERSSRMCGGVERHRLSRAAPRRSIRAHAARCDATSLRTSPSTPLARLAVACVRAREERNRRRRARCGAPMSSSAAARPRST